MSINIYIYYFFTVKVYFNIQISDFLCFLSSSEKNDFTVHKKTGVR